MREAVLQRKGWSKQEIDRAKKILLEAESKKTSKQKKIEHIIFWTVIAVLVAGGVAFTFQILPIVALASPVFWVPLSFVGGALLGLLLVHVIHDIKLERKHHHIGAFVLTVAVILLVLFVLLAAQRLTHLSVGMTFLFAMVLGLGVAVPYVTHWRVFGESY